MSHRGVSVLAVSALLIAAFAAPGSASAAPSQRRKPAAHGHVHRPSASAVRAALARGHQPAPAPIPRVDPQLQTIAPSAHGTIEVTLHGKAAALAAAVKNVGGRSISAAGDARTAIVPRTALATLAQAPGLTAVRRPVRAYPDVISQGVAASHADTWQTAGQNGAGVKVGVVDVGFANLSDEMTAGNLPADTTITNHCANVDNTQHGTAVAEIVHQMAPSAQLFLYCIDDSVGFQQAEQEIQSAGIKIVNSSLSFPGDSRGDGTGSAGSAATTVKTARDAGILWIQSAGNNGEDHWSGTLTDVGHDGLVDINGTTCNNTSCDEADDFDIGPGGSGAAVLKWDKWPTVASAVPLTLDAVGFQCLDAGCTTLNQNPFDSLSASQAANQPPVLAISLPTNTSGFDQVWDVFIEIGTGVPAVSYDLSYWGDVSNSFLSTVNPTRAAMSSITEPASSPYALAVGAAEVANSSLEPFSSQGPTIDGRVKPDITGFDDVSSNLADLNPFFGTSSASPHVAGAAALVAGANPNMDAAQIQDFLERRAGTSPPTNQLGHGVLNLGDPSNVNPPVGSGYTALASPQRILDTRRTSGLLGTNATVTVTVPGIPDDATAVAINLTGVTNGATFLSVFPGGLPWPGTSNLNLATTDKTEAVYAVVPLGTGAAAKQITVLNGGAPTYAIVDLLGYYSPTATGKYNALTPVRILDTRQTTPHVQLGSGQSLKVPTTNAGIPAGANPSAVIINVTATGQKAVGDLDISPDCSGTTSTLNYQTFTRANMSIAGLDATGGFCVLNHGGPVDVLIDVLGYVSATSGASFVPLASPVRVVDTRKGNGGQLGPLGAGGTLSLQGAGIFDVPYSATAVLADVVATAPTATSFITVYPGTTRPNISTVNFTSGRTVSNADVANLSSGTANIFNAGGNVQVIVDLFGYFV